MPTRSRNTRLVNSLLLATLPEALNVSGEDYAIHSDYQTVLRFFELQRDDRVAERHKGIVSLKMFYGDKLPHDFEAAFKQLGWFIRCGKPEEEGKRPRPTFDFSFDAPLIFASFWAQYGLDLTAPPLLHWWKFHALFTGLGDDTAFRQVVHIRTRKEDGLDAASKQELREAKKAWALPPEVFKDKRTDELAAALMRGDAQSIKRALK